MAPSPHISMKDISKATKKSHKRVRQTSQHKEGKIQANAYMRRHVGGMQACEIVLGIIIYQGHANIKAQGGNTSYQLSTKMANIKKIDNTKY